MKKRTSIILIEVDIANYLEYSTIKFNLGRYAQSLSFNTSLDKINIKVKLINDHYLSRRQKLYKLLSVREKK